MLQQDSEAQEVPGLLVHRDALDVEQEDSILTRLSEEVTDWDCSTRQKFKHFGFKFDLKGQNVQPSTPIPVFLWEEHHIAAQLLLKSGIDHTLNQCTVVVYEPGVGIGDYTENPLLGDAVVTIGLQGSLTIVFTPHDESGSQPTMFYQVRCTALAMAGECLKKMKHGIPTRVEDEWEGETVKRTQHTALIFRNVPEPPNKNE